MLFTLTIVMGLFIFFVSFSTLKFDTIKIPGFRLIVIGFGVLDFFTANFIPVMFGVADHEETENSAPAVNDVNFLAFAGFLFGPPLIGLIAKSVSITACMIILDIAWAIIAIALMMSGKLNNVIKPSGMAFKKNR